MQNHLVPSPPRPLTIAGLGVTILMSAADTGGAYGMIQTAVPPGMGPSAHVHTREDETFYVLAGTGEFRIGDRLTRHGPGDTLWGPRGIPHGYRNVGEDELRVLILYTPGGCEQIFQQWSAITDPSQLSQIFARAGMRGA